MRLERVMCPAKASISASNNNCLTVKSECPHVRRVRVSDPRLDGGRRCGAAALQSGLLDWTSFRKIIVNVRVACDVRHVGASRQGFGKLAISFYQNCVDDIERLRLDVAVAQPLKHWRLGALGFFQQRLINEAA